MMLEGQERIDLLQAELKHARLRAMAWRVTFYLLASGLLGMWLYHEFPEFRRYSDNQYTCQRNLRRIGKALDIYANAHEGEYPRLADGAPTLEPLASGYISDLPVCPENGATYGVLYGANGQWNTSDTENYYQVWCRGNHPENPPGFPWIDSLRGLVRIPDGIKAPR